MPQRKSGVDELKKSHKRHMHNLDIKTDLRKTIKGFAKLVEDKNLADAKKQLATLFKKLDKASKRNTISKNTASRRKSLFSRQLNTINK